MSKVILITGATDGIGLLTAEKLVMADHHVLLHGRNEEKLQGVKRKLRNLKKGEVASFKADLSDFSEVENLATEIERQYSNIDVIINNAGIYKTNTPITKDNLDVRFVVNTIAPYLLTKRLLPLMNNTGRVVNVSSAAQAPVDLDAFTGKYHLQEQMSAYAQSKLGITMWTRYLAQKLGNAGTAIIAVNPASLLASKMVKEGFGVEGKDLNIGADILIQASLSEAFCRASGKYFDNDAGQFAEPHMHALDESNCEKLVKTMDALLQ